MFNPLQIVYEEYHTENNHASGMHTVTDKAKLQAMGEAYVMLILAVYPSALSENGDLLKGGTGSLPESLQSKFHRPRSVQGDGSRVIQYNAVRALLKSKREEKEMKRKVEEFGKKLEVVEELARQVHQAQELQKKQQEQQAQQQQQALQQVQQAQQSRQAEAQEAQEAQEALQIKQARELQQEQQVQTSQQLQQAQKEQQAMQVWEAQQVERVQQVQEAQQARKVQQERKEKAQYALERFQQNEYIEIYKKLADGNLRYDKDIAYVDMMEFTFSPADLKMLMTLHD